MAEEGVNIPIDIKLRSLDLSKAPKDIQKSVDAMVKKAGDSVGNLYKKVFKESTRATISSTSGFIKQTREMAASIKNANKAVTRASQKRIEELTEQMLINQDEINTLRKTQDAKRQQYQKSQREASENRKKVAELQAENSKLESAMGSFTTRKKEFAKERANYQSGKVNVFDLYEAKRDSGANPTKPELERLYKKKKAIDVEAAAYADSEKAIEENARAIAELESNIKLLTTSAKPLSLDIADIKSRIAELTKENTSLVAEQQKLETTGTAKDVANEASSDIKSSSRNIEFLYEKYQLLCEEGLRLAEELQTATDRSDTTFDAWVDASAALEDAEEDLNRLEEEYKNLRKNHRASHGKKLEIEQKKWDIENIYMPEAAAARAGFEVSDNRREKAAKNKSTNEVAISAVTKELKSQVGILDGAKKKLKEYNIALVGLAAKSAFKGKFGEAFNILRGKGPASGNTQDEAGGGGGSAKSKKGGGFLAGILSGTKKAGKAFSAIGKKLKKGLTIFRKYGLGFRTLFSMVASLKQYIAQAFNQLAMDSEEVRLQLAKMRQDLTLVKANLATMLQPFLASATQIFTKVTDFLSGIMDKIGQIGAAIMGNETYWKATVGDVKEYQSLTNKLADYDKLSVIQSDNNNGMTGVKYVETEVGDEAKETAEKLQPLIDGFKEIGKAIGEMFSNIDITGLFTSIVNILGIVAPIIAEIITLISPIISQLIEYLGPFLEKVAGIILPLLTAALEVIMPILSQLIEIIMPILMQILDALAPVFDVIAKEVFPLIGMLLEALMPLISGILNLVVSILDPILRLIAPLIKIITTILEPIIRLLEPIFSIIGMIADLIGDILGPVLDLLAPILDAIAEVLDFLMIPINWIISILSGALKIAIQGIISVIEFLMKPLKLLLEFLKGLFEKIAEWTGKIKDGAKNVVNFLINIFEKFINFFIKGWNGLLGILNKFSFDIPDWIPGIGGKKFGFDIPLAKEISIPRLAMGAVIPPNREFLAMLGDQRSGTNIEAPLETIKQAVREVLANEPGNAPIVLQLDGRVIARVVWDETQKQYRQTGGAY